MYIVQLDLWYLIQVIDIERVMKGDDGGGAGWGGYVKGQNWPL